MAAVIAAVSAIVVNSSTVLQISYFFVRKELNYIVMKARIIFVK